MLKFDLLPADSSAKAEVLANTAETIFDDLAFARLERFFPEEPAHLARFQAALQCLPTEVAPILKRQQILKDFLASPSLAGRMTSICEQAALCKTALNPYSHRLVSPADRLKAGLRATEKLLAVVADMGRLLAGRPFLAPVLAQMQAYFGAEEKWARLELCLQDIERAISGETELAVSFNTLLQVAKGRVALIAKGRRPTVPLTLNRSLILSDARDKMLLHLSGVVSHINVSLRGVFLQIAVDVRFYEAARRIYEGFSQARMPLCWPEVSESRQISARGLWDMALAARMDLENERPVGNDLSDGGALYLITGVNQGGKTTFLRSLGMAQLFAQSGLFTPASSYRCGAFPALITHFLKEEDKTLHSGKLESELLALRRALPLAKQGALFLFNESFSTTTAKEGEAIAADVLSAVCKTDSLVFYVTHFPALAMENGPMAGRTSGKPLVSLSAQMGENGKARTFVIVPSPPYEEMFARDMITWPD